MPGCPSPGRAATIGLIAALLAPGTPTAQEGEWPPPLHLGGGAFTIRPTGVLHLDLGTTFAHSSPGGPNSGINARRARLGVEGRVGEDFEYTFIWDFGGSPGRRGRLYEASIEYSGLRHATVTLGVFEASYSLLQSRSARHLLFLERPAATEVASDLAAGSGRVGAEIRAHGERWFASAALTGGRTGPGEDSGQRGAVARLSALPVRSETVTVHLGVSGGWSFRPARGEDGRRSVDLSDSGELNVDRRSTLDPGAIPARGAWSLGPEIAVAWGRLLAQAEGYRVAVNRAGADGGRLDFAGWYAQATYVVVGAPRPYRAERAAWGLPQGRFDPARGEWGAVEIGLRYSTLDLNDGDVRGGGQRLWSTGVGWWPSEQVGVLAQWQNGRIMGAENGDRRWQALSTRLLLQF